MIFCELKFCQLYFYSMNNTDLLNESDTFSVSEDIIGSLLAAVLGIEMILAIIANSFVILYTISHITILKQPSTIFLSSLAVANLVLSSLFIPFTVISAAAGEWIFGRTEEEKEATCKFVGFIFAFAVGLSIHTLALISFDRFLLIVKPFIYKQYMKTWTAALIVLILWIVAALLDITPFFGFGEYAFAQSTASCLPLWSGQMGYVVFFSIISIVPFTTIIVTSLWTFIFTKNFIKRQNESTVTSEQQRNVYTNKTRNLIGIFGSLMIVNLASFLPYIIVSSIGVLIGFDRIPHQVYAALLVLFLLNNTTNPIVQMYFRRDLKEAVIQGLNMVKKRVHVCLLTSKSKEEEIKSSDSSSANKSNPEINDSITTNITLDF